MRWCHGRTAQSNGDMSSVSVSVAAGPRSVSAKARGSAMARTSHHHRRPASVPLRRRRMPAQGVHRTHAERRRAARTTQLAIGWHPAHIGLAARRCRRDKAGAASRPAGERLDVAQVGAPWCIRMRHKAAPRHRHRRLSVAARTSPRLHRLRPGAPAHRRPAARSHRRRRRGLADGASRHRGDRARSWRRPRTGGGAGLPWRQTGGRSLASVRERQCGIPRRYAPLDAEHPRGPRPRGRRS